MPYLHWETDRYRSQMVDVIDQTAGTNMDKEKDGEYDERNLRIHKREDQENDLRKEYAQSHIQGGQLGDIPSHTSLTSSTSVATIASSRQSFYSAPSGEGSLQSFYTARSGKNPHISPPPHNLQV
jgi:hypothetical protein